MRSYGTCEVLIAADASMKARLILEAMVAAAPIPCVVTQRWERRGRLLMTWGWGHTGRRPWLMQHMAQGGHVIGWDLGYWNREHSCRLTINHDHPRDMPAMDGSRWDSLGIPLRNDFDANGHVVLVGMGRKSRRVYANGWEQLTLPKLQRRFGGRLVYRPKTPETLPGVPSAYGPIEDVLKGASLVVCRHSNVAIDACIAGIPVVCEDGAAAALYGNDLNNPANPSEAERLAFLQRLAWWNWKPSEAAAAWKFVLSRTCA